MTEPTEPAPPFPVVEDFASFFARDPMLERRRLTLTVEQLVHMVVHWLAHRGLAPAMAERSRFVWSSDERGSPVLSVILPGPEA